jgi:hypothetical protein
MLGMSDKAAAAPRNRTGMGSPHQWKSKPQTVCNIPFGEGKMKPLESPGLCP